MRCGGVLEVVAVGLTTLLAGTVLAKAGGGEEGAQTAGLHCGDTISTSTRLTHDLACPGTDAPALTIVGTGVVLDLGGHTVRRTGPDTGFSEGIAVLADSMVKNGTIQGFELGYVLDYDAVHFPEHVWLSRLTFINNGNAVYNRSATATFTLTDSLLIGNRVGMSSEQDASRGTFEVRSTTFVGNQQALSANSHSVDVLLSNFSRNGLVIWCPDGSVSFKSSAIVQNTVVGQLTVGEFGYGTCQTASFVDMTIAGNGSFAPSDQPAWAPFEFVMRNSRVLGNSRGLLGRAQTVDIQGNTWLGNRGGLTLSEPPDFLDSELTGTVAYNHFQLNLGDGLRVTVPGAVTLTGNVALGNTGWGIHAPGVIDGGGNAARGNGAGNCVGVTCSSH